MNSGGFSLILEVAAERELANEGSRYNKVASKPPTHFL